MKPNSSVWQRRAHRGALSLFAVAAVLAGSAAARADLQIQEKVLGPVDDDTKYVFSPTGAHVALVARKGSRLNVIVDGVAGPRVDQVLTPAMGWVDARRAIARAGEYNTLPGNVTPAEPVTFSRDGNHFAYVAKMSNEWVVFRDGKELQRVPPALTPDGFRLEFARDDGGALLFTIGTASGDEFWVDGVKWPGYVHTNASGTYGPIDPVVSPDGEHIACFATIDRKDVVILDGKPTAYLGEDLEFTSDSKHLLCLARGPSGQSVLVDGKPLFTAREIIQYYVAPVGHRVAAVLTHLNRQTNMREGVFLLVDGKPVDATLGEEIKGVLFSPDGKHYAAICGKAGTRFMVLDGKKGEEYQDIDTTLHPARFSPDSSKIVYIAQSAGKSFIVVNADESDAFSGFPEFFLSPDGQHVAVVGVANNQNELVMDGTVVARVPANRTLAPVVFSPDSRRYAAGGGIVIDGLMTKNAPGSCIFSPDSKHYAILSNVVYIDGVPVSTSGWNGIGRQFSPDGQHFCWIGREPNTAADAAPNSYVEVIYVDGQRALQLDDFLNGPANERLLYSSKIAQMPWLMPREWSFGQDGTFVCIGPIAGVLKRFTITLSPATSVSTLLTTGKAAATLPASATGPAPGSTAPAARAAVAQKQVSAADAAVTKATNKVNAAAAKAKSWLDALGRR